MHDWFRQYDYEKKERPRSRDEIDRNKRVVEIIIAIASIIFIIVLCGVNYVKPLDKVYSADSFYLGANQVDSREDPIKTYKQMYGQAIIGADGPCKTDFVTIDGEKLLTFGSGTAVPAILSDDKGFNASGDVEAWFNQFTGESLGIDGNSNRWYLWYNAAEGDDMRIIAPWQAITFRNSNFDASSIEVGTPRDNSYLVINNIGNWFCHMDKDKLCKSHTIKIGKGAEDEQLRGFTALGGEFTIIGKATKDTYITGMKDDGGNLVECSPAEVLGIGQYSSSNQEQ